MTVPLAAPLRLLLLPLVLLALIASASAQLQNGSIRGTITSANGDPLPGIAIRISAEGVVGAATAYTDADGTFETQLLAPGVYELHISMPGFQTTVISVHVESGGTTSISVTMQPSTLGG